jgi:hypothetical protein
MHAASGFPGAVQAEMTMEIMIAYAVPLTTRSQGVGNKGEPVKICFTSDEQFGLGSRLVIINIAGIEYEYSIVKMVGLQ